MSAMPEIGSKISLISKADIRYEGKLFTVDPNECTIALASVRSFGTEDRQTQFPVPAQSQVYDYILFRGSDIKDISIVHSQPLPNDPAIVSGMAPSINQPPSYQQPQFNHPAMGMGPSMGQYNAYNPMNNMAPGIGRTMTKQMPMSVLELIHGSRSSTPGLLARKSPTMDQSVQVSGPSPHKDDKNINHRSGGQNPVRDGRHSRGDRGYQDNGYHRHQMHEKNEYRYRDNYNQNRREMYNQGGQGLPQRNQNQQVSGNNRGWSRMNTGGPRPRGRGRPNSQQNFRGQNQSGKKNLLKFDEEYDFDKANTAFEEEYKLLRNQMSKVKLTDNVEPTEVVKVNGEDKKDDSGNETGVGETETEEDPTGEVFYDKAKSFFDNISCEAVERSKGRSQRTDWRTERKLNSETFGVASARRGHFRGRGGYYHGRGMYRGGYGMSRGGYNRGQGNRPVPRSANPTQNSNSIRPQAQVAQAK